MPTAKEIDLFMQAEGGSGDAKEDALVARNLQNILDMPEQQVLSFIKTRDRNTVHKLRMVLQDMPSMDWASASGSRVGSRAASQAASQRSKSLSHTPSNRRSARTAARHQQQFSAVQGRIDEMAKIGTSYGNFFGSTPFSPPTAIKHEQTAKAFDGVVRKGYQPEFEQWREAANEDQVRVLADACRSLRYFSSSGMPLTTYNGTFASATNFKPQRPKDRDNSRNVSAVPLGSIYSQSEAEARSAMLRKAQYDEQLAAARRTIESHRKLAAATLLDKPKMDICIYTDPATATAGECFEATHHNPGNSRSAARMSWHGDVHSKTQVKRHAHSAINPGETAWRQCAATKIFDLRDPTLEAGPPSADKLVKSKFRGLGKSMTMSASQPALPVTMASTS